ncbi:MAG: pseudaminic acid cytidylyltransferase [Treponema sp.]|nr:pseudaminic acid cytidylyltransferase [Treponema sp.]
MTRIAIIPARGGSKRIPRKNIKDFCGRPILVYSIEAALKTDLFDEVMVSTDDEEIAEIAKKYGAAVPFMRSAATANDFAILRDVLDEVLAGYLKQGKTFDEVCCLLPTAPFLKVEDIVNAHAILEEKECTSVVPVVKYSYTIFRSLKIEDGRLVMNWPENYAKRSQDLPEAYHDAGLFYWYNRKYFEEKTVGFGENAHPYILDEEKVQDIDTPDDWKMAEMKYKLFHMNQDAQPRP